MNYTQFECERIAYTFKGVYPSGIPYDGYKICVLKLENGKYEGWVDETDSISSSHNFTEELDSRSEAILAARKLLRNRDAKQT